MYSRYRFLGILAILASAKLILAGPGGYLSLINATPYDWKLTHEHEYQMDWKFPPVIPAGTSHEQYFEYFWSYHDSAAEATYELVNTTYVKFFTVQARQNPWHINIQYNDLLSSLNNDLKSNIDLGFEWDGIVSFILAGDGEDTPFISSNAPIAWQQATLPAISTKSLREICLPTSHNAGMTSLSGFYGGVNHNTQCQSEGIYEQAIHGARFFDIRPVYHRGQIHAGHFSKFLWTQAGGTGMSLQDIVADINKFNLEFPGELLILDIGHDMNMDHSFHPLGEEQWQDALNMLSEITDLWVPPPTPLDFDLTSVPISTFIQPGSHSSVLLRIVEAAANGTTPTPNPRSYTHPPSTAITYTNAFITEPHYPIYGSYSETTSLSHLLHDQLSKLSEFRNNANDPVLRSTWTITQNILQILDIGSWGTSIMGGARGAKRELLKGLWGELVPVKKGRGGRWPNMIEVDDFKDEKVKVLCMGINEVFVAGGKEHHVVVSSERKGGIFG